MHHNVCDSTLFLHQRRNHQVFRHTHVVLHIPLWIWSLNLSSVGCSRVSCRPVDSSLQIHERYQKKTYHTNTGLNMFLCMLVIIINCHIDHSTILFRPDNQLRFNVVSRSFILRVLYLKKSYVGKPFTRQEVGHELSEEPYMI